MGNLGKDPEIRTFPNGGKVCNFPVATSETWRDRNSGEKQERTQWHNIAIFSEDAVFHVNDAELTPKDVVNAFMTGHEYYDDIKNIDRTTTTMFYNNGEIYTNYWYTWNGTNKKTGELLVARGYAWFKWDGLKVIEAYNAFDPTEYNKAFSD